MDETQQALAMQYLYGQQNDEAPADNTYVDDSDQPQDSGALAQVAGSYEGLPEDGDTIGIAESHLQDVIANLTQRQAAMNERMNPATGPTRATAMAFLGGLGQGYGSFGTNIAKGMSAAAPYEQHATTAYSQGLSKMDELRIRAAQAESLNNYRGTRRHDTYAKMGMKLGPDGKLTIDPVAMSALQMRAKATEAGKLGAQGLDAFGPADGGAPGEAPQTNIMPNKPGTTESTDLTPTPALDEKIAGMNLRPAVASQLKSVLEGRQQIQGYMLRNPYWQKMLQTANQIDPDFDTSNYSARSKLRQDFTSGPSARGINALNTVAGHINKLLTEGEKLNNTWSPTFNWVTNKATTLAGDPRVNNFNIAKNAVSSELSKAYKQTGAITKDEKEEWESSLNNAMSPPQLQGAVKTIAELLESKINAFNDQYKKGMGVAGENANFVSPHAQALFTKFSAGKFESTEQHDELPDPSQYEGKIATDSKTGNKFKSDGKAWNPL